LLGSSLLVHNFVAHTDAVWDIKVSSNEQNPLLASASADRSVKLWDSRESHESLQTTLTCVEDSTASPTSIDWLGLQLNQIAVSYQDSIVRLFDIETGNVVLKLQSDETADGTPNTQINKIICHPTMPLIISAHEDKYIRFFDINSGNYPSF
jgi:striatin 1/3/4